MPIVTTVLERVDSDSFGTVLAAETLLCTPPEARGNAGRPASEAVFERAPVTMGRLGRLLLGAVNRDDRTLEGADAEAALDALAAGALRASNTGRDPVAADAAGAESFGPEGLGPEILGPERSGSGVGAALGATPLVIALAGRGSTADPALLARLSRASGVAIVRGVDGSAAPGGPDPRDEAGALHAEPPRRDPEALAERIAAALAAREHPAGVVGALPLPVAGAASGETDADIARIEAAAAAAHSGGAALVLAPRADPWGVALPGAPDAEALRRALAAADAAGLDRSRVVLAGAAAHLAHRDAAGRAGVGIDPARLAALLEHGTMICFDDLGRIPNVRTAVSDHDVALAILRCAASGAADRILLSSGIRNKHRLAAFGGNGLEFVPQQFLPYLAMLGADAALVRAVGGGNAARACAREAREGASE